MVLARYSNILIKPALYWQAHGPLWHPGKVAFFYILTQKVHVLSTVLGLKL